MSTYMRTLNQYLDYLQRIINVPQAVKPKLSAANSKSKAAEPVALTSPEPKAVVPKLKASESELKLAKLVAPVQPAAQEQKAAETVAPTAPEPN